MSDRKILPETLTSGALEPSAPPEPPEHKAAGWIAGGSVLYTLVRYVAFLPENAAMPMFLLNKAVSMAGAIFLVVALFHRLRDRQAQAAFFFQVMLFAIVMHVALSLALLKPAYF